MAIDNIRTSGGIFTHHFVESLQQDTLNHPAVRPEAFTLPGHDRVTEAAFEKAVANAWEALVERWDKVEREFGTYDISTLRGQWLRPLFYRLNLETEFQRGDTVLEGDLRFPLSHLGRAGTTAFTLPVHSVLYTADTSLETRVGTGRGIKTLAPHDMVQRYLNLSKEHDWAIVTDGVYLRLLRDFHHTYTRGYVEFDLQGIFSSRDYAAFRALYRLLHASRFIVPEGKEAAPVDELYEDSLAIGVKVGEDLRKNVQAAIESLANGFLTSSPGFHDQVRATEDGAAQLYRDVLMTIYRMLFLLFAEQRGMLPGRGSLYMDEFSLTSLRTLAEQPLGEDRNIDLWEKMKTTIVMVEHGVEDLEIYAYNGALFSLGRTPLLTPKDVSQAPSCRNDHFLVTVKHLTTVDKDKVLQRISYADLSVEEIGSIYESLLEFTPQISGSRLEVEGREIQANTFFLDPRGSGRKTSGSYYTPPSLVNELIKSALVPVMEDRLRAVVPGYDSEYVEALNPEERQAAEAALLTIKVVDPAAGSGAFLIAANNKLGLELARIRTGDLFPAEKEIQGARRDVLAHCIYAVDLNPMAVELCKVSLWINAAVEDAPLNFLDHHIKCGNSLVGATPALIAEGIPNEAYNPVTGDDKDFAKAIKAQNREELKGQMSLVRVSPLETKEDLQKWQEIDRLAETDPNQAEAEYQAYWKSKEYWDKRLPFDLWTAAFFAPLTEGYPVPTTQDVKQALISPNVVPFQTKEKIQTLAQQFCLLHWHLEFPQVYDENGEGGFDVVLGNPPWEMINLIEKEFFEGKADYIVNASTGAKRKQLIEKLRQRNPDLWEEFITTLRDSECVAKFLRDSGAYPLTAYGRINTYSVFSGKARTLMKSPGRVGIIVPTGIATDNSTKQFFSTLVETNQLASLLDFENRKGLFPGVHRSYKFCLLTLQKSQESVTHTARFAFFLQHPNDLLIEDKIFELTRYDFQLLNPNTLTCPIFRTRNDANLTRKIYKAAPVLINEQIGENPWKMSFKQGIFNMTSDSQLFRTRQDLEAQGYELQGNVFVQGKDEWLPLYEAKMFWHYDHRFGTYDGVDSRSNVHLNKFESSNPEDMILPWYWVPRNEILSRIYPRKWLLVFRDITNVTNERTVIFSIIPFTGVGHTSPIALLNIENSTVTAIILACANSLVFDYVARQKIGGTHLTYNYLKQLPILKPSIFSPRIILFIIPKLLELIFTSWDISPFGDDIWQYADNELQIQLLNQWKENSDVTNWKLDDIEPKWLRLYYHGTLPEERFPKSPFIWDDDRRFLLRCELDAIFGHLYGLTRDEFDYILETFPIVKRKDEAQFGEYRTKRVILENFDKLADDPMLDGVCVPLNERVSVLEHPEKEQPRAPKMTNPVQVVSEDESAYATSVPKKDTSAPSAEMKKPKPKSVPENQQTMFAESTDFSATKSDYGLYRCKKCGKPLMGFSLDEHMNDVHNGNDPGYEKLK